MPACLPCMWYYLTYDGLGDSSSASLCVPFELPVESRRRFTDLAWLKSSRAWRKSAARLLLEYLVSSSLSSSWFSMPLSAATDNSFALPLPWPSFPIRGGPFVSGATLRFFLLCFAALLSCDQPPCLSMSASSLVMVVTARLGNSSSSLLCTFWA